MLFAGGAGPRSVTVQFIGHNARTALQYRSTAGPPERRSHF
jgi:hypothetical protein